MAAKNVNNKSNETVAINTNIIDTVQSSLSAIITTKDKRNINSFINKYDNSYNEHWKTSLVPNKK